MTLQEYSEAALKTKKYKYEIIMNNKVSLPWVYPALKLAGEAGEVAEKIGKIIRDQEGQLFKEDRTALLKELGDVQWYINALADDLGSSLEEVMTMNIAKLASRAERGVLHGSGDNR